MNKHITNFIVTILLSVALSYVLPWYAVMIAALLSALLIPLEKVAVFLVPFFAVLLYWGVYCYILSSANDFTLAKKIGQLLTIGDNPYLLILLTGIIGGLAAGISGVLGNQIAGLVRNKQP